MHVRFLISEWYELDTSGINSQYCSTIVMKLVWTLKHISKYFYTNLPEPLSF